jgi:hypothetical protein
MANNRRAGLIWLKIDGRLAEAKGEFTLNPGLPKRDGIIGATGPSGFKETPQIAFLEGAVTDSDELDTVALRKIDDATVTLELNNGKQWVYDHAWYAGEGSMTTGEGEIGVRFESNSPAREI